MNESHNQASAPSTTSLSLLACLKRNDPHAWERVVYLYSPFVYGRCRRAGLNPSDAADVMQEVFRAVHRTVQDFRRDQPGDSFRAWLSTITRNKVYDFFRLAGRQEKADGGSTAARLLDQHPDSDHEVESSCDDDLYGAVLRRGMELVQASCEPNTWQAFWRTAIDDQSTEDVAAELGMTPVAVRKAKSRVLRRLRDELSELIL